MCPSRPWHKVTLQASMTLQCLGNCRHDTSSVLCAARERRMLRDGGEQRREHLNCQRAHKRWPFGAAHDGVLSRNRLIHSGLGVALIAPVCHTPIQNSARTRIAAKYRRVYLVAQHNTSANIMRAFVHTVRAVHRASLLATARD